MVTYPRRLHFQGPGSSHDLPGRLVSVAHHQAFTILVTPAVLLLEKSLHLSFDGLLKHLLSAPTNHLIEQAASIKLLIDLFLWHDAAENRSLVHGVSFQPSLGQLMKRNHNHQQDTPLFSPLLEHNF